MNKTQRIISKHSLVLMAKGEQEIASQIFVFDHMREIRANLEKLEVVVLMDYDQNYHRVFKINIKNEEEKNEAKKIVLDFYNKLSSAAMKLTDEELKNIKKQQEMKLKK